MRGHAAGMTTSMIVEIGGDLQTMVLRLGRTQFICSQRIVPSGLDFGFWIAAIHNILVRFAKYAITIEST